MQIFWILFGAFLLILEVFTASFFALFFGLSSILIAFSLFFFVLTWTYQLFFFITASLVLLLFFRKMLKRRFFSSEPTMTQSLVGEIGIVTQTIFPHAHGRIKIRDTEWTAIASELIDIETKVLVLSFNNLTVEVKSL